MKTSYHRGNIIQFINKVWIYAQDKVPVSSDNDRQCGHCGKENTTEGYDACLGTLPGVMNACCGHGIDSEAYVQFRNGSDIRGKDAINYNQVTEQIGIE